LPRHDDEVTSKAKEAEIKRERKNYTYRLPIYLSELFSEVCRQKDISPVTLVEQWIANYVEPYDSKFGPKILSEIDDIVEAKKENERKSRLKQKRRRA
jgi:hypothetical protein